MSAAADPSGEASAAHNMFNEEEDLLDDEDESSDHDEDDSASSVAVALDLPTPSAGQVTVAVPGVPDPLINQQQLLHLPSSESKKPADESRKLFQRLWTDEDEIELLQGFLDYTTQRRGLYSSSQHHHDTSAFYDQIKSRFQLDFNKNQLVEKLRRLKKKYRNVVSKISSGKDYNFKSPHDQTTFEISSKIWGNVNGSSAPFRSPAVPIDEDDDDLNNPAFVNIQSPIPSTFDPNSSSKTPRPRKRNRAGSAIKLEEKQHLQQQQHHHPLFGHINNIPVQPQPQPQPQPPTVRPIAAAPALSMGISGVLSNVIEETVKNCLSPVLKELSSGSSNLLLSNGIHSPLSLCFPGSMAGDKTSDDRWRKQQIMELEVFSKRLELVQDHIRVQLQELRSMGN